MNDIVRDKLNTVEEDEEEIQVETTDREREFAKVTDILTDIRGRFLATDTMSLEDAIAEIQDELIKLAPAPKEAVGAPPMGPPGAVPLPGAGPTRI